MDYFNVDYNERFLTAEESGIFFDEFNGYNFIRPVFTIYGKTCQPRREMIAFGDPGLSYAFSGATFESHPWTNTLKTLKERVEKAVGTSFNFVLLNRYKDGKSRINAHKDDEKSLEPSSAIACISLGATREIVFKRRNYPEKKITLTDGSLYTMKSPTNLYWTHEIGPSETHLSRISLTFRNILPTTTPIRKRKQDEASCSATPEDVFDSATTTDFFKKLCVETQQNLYITPQNLTETEPSFPANRTIFKKNLSANIILSVELFRGNIRIDIRDYFIDSKNVLKPSKQGICLTLAEWFEARGKLMNFNLCYPQSAFIVNNSILFLSKDEYLEISKLFTPQIVVQLKSYATDLLKNVCNELNEAVIDFLFIEHMRDLILSHRGGCNEIIPTLSSEEEDRLFLQLIKCIENELAPRFFLLYPCNGCIIRHGSQLQHACMTTPNRDKLNFLGEEVLILCDMNVIVNEFMELNNFVSTHFLDTLNVKKIIEMLFV